MPKSARLLPGSSRHRLATIGRLGRTEWLSCDADATDCRCAHRISIMPGAGRGDYGGLHQFDEAQKWLKRAIALDRETVQQAALDDEDLKPLWDSLGGTMWKRK